MSSRAPSRRKLGLMGGTFDPIHLGHLIAAETAREALQLDEVVFIPAARPPHKDRRAQASAEHRHAMALIATEDHPAFRVSRVELDRQGPSYSIDTVRHFQESLDPAPEISFLTGADAMLEVNTWRRYEELLQTCRFVSLTRPGFVLEDLNECLTPEQMAGIAVVEMPLIEISATAIRRRCRAGQSIRYLVPEGVRAYIAKHALYRE